LIAFLSKKQPYSVPFCLDLYLDPNKLPSQIADSILVAVQIAEKCVMLVFELKKAIDCFL
jgi:hypothetical protein